MVSVPPALEVAQGDGVLHFYWVAHVHGAVGVEVHVVMDARGLRVLALQANEVLRDALDDVMEVYDVVLDGLEGVLAQGADLVAVCDSAGCDCEIHPPAGAGGAGGAVAGRAGGV